MPAWISVRLLICRKEREQDTCLFLFCRICCICSHIKTEDDAKMATLGDKVYGQWRFILAPLRTGMGLL